MHNVIKIYNKNNFLKLIFSICFITILSSSAHAIERHVNTTIDDRYLPGSLRYEISRSFDGDSIVFDPQLYGQTLTLKPYNGPLYVRYAISINGDLNGDSFPDITISGNNQTQLFTVSGPSYGAVLLKGLTITNGFSSGSGGCISNYSYREVTLLNTYVSNCTALRDGGGIFNRGRIVIDKSFILNNTASRGAGIVSFSGVQPVIKDSVLANNHSTRWGGAVYSYGDGTLHIERSIISDNTASGSGAGIFSHGSTESFSLKVIDTTIVNNFSKGTDTAEDLEGVGGGIRAGGLGDALVTNSTLSNNSAGRYGGAIIFRNAGSRIVRHSTIAYNRNDVGGLGPRDVELTIHLEVSIKVQVFRMIRVNQ